MYCESARALHAAANQIFKFAIMRSHDHDLRTRATALQHAPVQNSQIRLSRRRRGAETLSRRAIAPEICFQGTTVQRNLHGGKKKKEKKKLNHMSIRPS